MTESTPGGEDQHAANLIALAYLLSQMTIQLLQEGQVAEARSFVDLLETLQVKTEGNRSEQESKTIEDVLFQLRMAVVQGPPPKSDAPSEEPSPAAAPAPDESPDPSESA